MKELATWSKWVEIHMFIVILGEKPGLVVRAEGSCPRGCKFESSRILDGCKWC